tara:strand:+ start:1130 stop:1870 length:741 start_codon:yes stop_codon:yes gene_type:complete
MFGFELLYNYLSCLFNSEINENTIIFYLIDKGLLEYLTNSGIKNIKYLNKTSVLNFNKNKKYVNSVFRGKLTILQRNLTNWNNYTRVYRFFETTFLNSREFKTTTLISHFPILPWKRFYIGCTDYIDGIKPSNLTYPIMIGVDHFHRPFITIKYTYSELHCSEMKTGKITVFQRYTNDCKCWVGCSKRGPIMRFNGNSTFSNSEKKLFIENIICLVSGKKIRCYYYNGDNEGYHLYDCKIESITSK